jgi:hypothetical protein
MLNWRPHISNHILLACAISEEDEIVDVTAMLFAAVQV